MNDTVLQQLARDVAAQTVIDSWPFYLALLALSFVGTTLGAYIRSRMAKRGEIAATKADAEEIIRQLAENTRATKSVELSLAHGDWIQRERNSLKRLKLEQLIVAAFGIATWTGNDAKEILKGDSFAEKCPIDEFQMLSMLYFPELRAEADKVENLYREALVQGGPVRLEIFQLTAQIEQPSHSTRLGHRDMLLANRNRLQMRHKNALIQRAVAVHAAVQELSQAAHLLMEQLTAQPGAIQ